MKKILIIGLIVALALILVGGAGVVYAKMRGTDNNAGLTLTGYVSGDEVVRLYSYGSGTMMDEYGYGVCPGGTAPGYGRGGMMGAYGNGTCLGGDVYGYRPGGMMQGYGPGGMMGGRGMMNGRGWAIKNGEGPLHKYMIAAFAEAFDLTVDEVETRLANGDTLKDIALTQGLTQDELKDLVTQVRQEALDAAVADEVITQAQADLMLEHMSQYMGPGFGPGFGRGFGDCPMMDGDEAPQP